MGGNHENTLCEKYNFYRSLSFSKSGLYLTSIAWNSNEIASLRNHLVLFKKLEKGYDPVKLDHKFEHIFAISFIDTNSSSGPMLIICLFKFC